MLRVFCIFHGDETFLLYIRWSPDGGTLAVASEDSFVYLYNCGDYIAKAKCGGHNGPVRAVANTRNKKGLERFV